MTAPPALKHFDKLAADPASASELKRWITALAIHGELSQPSANAHHAPFSELCEIRKGNTKLLKKDLYAEPCPGLFPAFSGSGQDVWTEHPENSGTAVIVCSAGTHCGKASLASRRWSATSNTHIVTPKKGVTIAAYLLLIADNEEFWIRGGTAQPFIKAGRTLSERTVYLPPLAEQKKIVAKVKSLHGQVDLLTSAFAERERRRDHLNRSSLEKIRSSPDTRTLRASCKFHFQILERVTVRPDQIPHLRQAIVDLAIRGQLAPQNKKEPPAPTRSETPQEWPIDPIPFPIPENWRWQRIFETSEHTTTGPRGWSKFYSESGAPFLTMGNLSRNHYRLRMHPMHYVNPPAVGQGLGSRIQVGDILISTTRDIGLLGHVSEDIGEAYVSQHVCLLRPLPPLRTRYLAEFMLSSFAQEELRKTLPGPIRCLRLSDLRILPVPLPPVAEQRRIVAMLDKLMIRCDELESSLTQSQFNSRNLLESVISSLQSPPVTSR